MSDSNANPENASQVRGHANYIAAAAKETLGSYTSTDLQKAGADDKQAALNEMRAAKAASEAQGGELNKNETLGTVEQKLGSVTGCEGMVDEGAKRQS